MKKITIENKEKIVRLAKKLIAYSEDEVKFILWSLCYQPLIQLVQFGLDQTIDPRQVKYEILNQYKAAHPEFVFGEKEQKISSYGVDLKIGDPVVRDYLIEACMEVAKDSYLLRYCICNFCTRTDNFEYQERRREAFEILDLDVNEQEFLEKNYNVFYIGELLKTLQKVFYPEQFTKKESEKKQAQVEEKTEDRALLSESFHQKKEKLDSEKLIQNKDLVKVFFREFSELGSIAFFSIFDNPKSDEGTICVEFEHVQRIRNLSKTLEKTGIDPKLLVKKEGKVKEFFSSVEKLA